MNRIIIGLLGSALGIIIGVSVMRNTRPEPAQQVVATAVPLSNMALDMMDAPRCKGADKDAMSPARRAVLAKQIDRILTTAGGTRNTQETFILLLCIETKFRTGLRSPAGALGISQLMPATAKAEATSMGLGELKPDELMDPELNLLIGYTHFMGLVDRFNGNHAKAAASYNAGPAGSTVKGLSNGTPGAAETDRYVRDLFYLQETRRVANSQDK